MNTTVHLTYDEFERLVEAGEFASGARRVELIRGEIHEMMSPADVRHDYAIDVLAEWSFDNAPRRRVRVRVQNGLGIPELASLTVPDLAWVVRRSGRRRPTGRDVFLLIEVSDTSLRYDRVDKGALYSQAGIADYWIVNIRAECVEVHRDPGPDGYRDIRTFAAGEIIRPLHFPAIELAVSSLFLPNADELDDDEADGIDTDGAAQA